MTVNLFIMCFSPAKQAEYNSTGVSFEDTTDALPSHVITETGAMEVSSDQQTTLSKTAASQQDTQGTAQNSLPSHWGRGVLYYDFDYDDDEDDDYYCYYYSTWK